MLEQEVEKLLAIMESLTARRAELLAEADELKAQGITNGRPDWNRKKYLYLRFPTQSGERARQYIGSDLKTTHHRPNQTTHHKPPPTTEYVHINHHEDKNY